jgi:hypothetical protein
MHQLLHKRRLWTNLKASHSRTAATLADPQSFRRCRNGVIDRVAQDRRHGVCSGKDARETSGSIPSTSRPSSSRICSTVRKTRPIGSWSTRAPSPASAPSPREIAGTRGRARMTWREGRARCTDNMRVHQREAFLLRSFLRALQKSLIKRLIAFCLLLESA